MIRGLKQALCGLAVLLLLVGCASRAPATMEQWQYLSASEHLGHTQNLAAMRARNGAVETRLAHAASLLKDADIRIRRQAIPLLEGLAQGGSREAMIILVGASINGRLGVLSLEYWRAYQATLADFLPAQPLLEALERDRQRLQQLLSATATWHPLYREAFAICSAKPEGLRPMLDDELGVWQLDYVSDCLLDLAEEVSPEQLQQRLALRARFEALTCQLSRTRLNECIAVGYQQLAEGEIQWGRASHVALAANAVADIYDQNRRYLPVHMLESDYRYLSGSVSKRLIFAMGAVNQGQVPAAVAALEEALAKARVPIEKAMLQKALAMSLYLSPEAEQQQRVVELLEQAFNLQALSPKEQHLLLATLANIYRLRQQPNKALLSFARLHAMPTNPFLWLPETVEQNILKNLSIQ